MAFTRRAVMTVTLLVLAEGLLQPFASVGASPPPNPKPIPGGLTLPDGSVAHVFGPGPKSLGFQGRDIEPNTITDFHGFVAMAYLNGTATGSDGKTYNVGLSDMRVFRGTYIGAGGLEHHGTFGFI